MNILFLNHNVAYSGGTFFRAFHCARGLARRGHRVCLLTISPWRRTGFDRRFVDGIDVVETPDLFWGRGRTGWDPWDTLCRISFLKNREWDVVHGWDCRPVVIGPAMFGRWMSRDRAGILALDWCDWWGRGGTQTERPGGISRFFYEPLETMFEEAFRLRANVTTVISDALRSRAIELGVPPGQILNLPQGCDGECLPRGEQEEARRRLGISCQHGLLLTVGAVLRSDADLLFAAVRALHDRMPETRLYMVGRTGVEVPRDLERDGVVQEMGFVTEAVLRDFSAACDAVVIPLADSLANRARWPSKANSFLAMGRAVVITRVGDLAKTLEEAGAAFMSDPEPTPFARAMEECLSDRDAWTNRVAKARQLATGLLSWDSVVRSLEAHYRRALSPNVPHPADSGLR